MSGTNTSPSQQPCLSCKRRRVRCDASKPSCKRCQKDDIQCPGYVRIREWSSTSKAKPLSRPTSVKNDSSDAASPNSTWSSIATPDSEPDSFLACIPSWLLSADKESPLLLDCIKYFNEQQVPSRMPAQAPFRRQKYLVVYRPDMPVLFRQLLIVTVRTVQAAINQKDPLSDAEICRYRARSLAGLKSLVSDAAFDACGLTLGFVIMFMLTDLHTLQTGSWKYHLEAARKIIAFRGGFSHCFRSLPAPRPLLINYMMVDVCSATTCSVLSLERQSVETQLDYISSIPDEEEITSNGNPVPQALLVDIIYTTLLRVSQKDTTGYMCKSFPAPQDSASILRSIENFDALSWANRVAFYGRTHPQKPTDCAPTEYIFGWSALAICYKSAAMLYLLLSCPNPLEESVERRLHLAMCTLSRYMRFLLDGSSLDPDGPVETQLWKYLGWPMLISAYVRIGWGIGEESVDAEVERLLETAKRTGRMSMLQSSDFLKSVLIRRSEDVETRWTWDDGLDSSFLFF